MELEFGRFRIEYEPDEDYSVSLYDEDDECIDFWDDPEIALIDIDISPVGEEITLEQWQSVWDFLRSLP